jgi:hypothetical protein
MFKTALACAAISALLVEEADAHYSWRYHRHYYNPYWYNRYYVTKTYGWAGSPSISSADTLFGGTLLKQQSNTGLSTYIKSYFSGLSTFTNGTVYAIGLETSTTVGAVTTKTYA